MEAFRTERYEAAVEALTQAIELDDTQADSYMGRALSRSRIGDPKGALEDWDRALALDESMTRAGRAVIRFEVGDLTGALADCEWLLEREPDEWQYFFWRGRIRSRLGDHEATIADLSRALEGAGSIWPDAEIWRERGLAYEALGDLEAAQRDLEAALQRSPEDTVSREALERIEGRLGPSLPPDSGP